MRTEIYLLRHGETGLNVKKVYFGHLNTAMTELGRESIKHLASNFFGSLDVIVSSDLDRCHESATIFKHHKKAEILLDERLRELDFGVFEGRTYEDLLKEFPKESECFFSGDHDYVIPDGESIQMLFDRTFDVFEETIKKHEGKKILFSTHGAPFVPFFQNTSLEITRGIGSLQWIMLP